MAATTNCDGRGMVRAYTGLLLALCGWSAEGLRALAGPPAAGLAKRCGGGVRALAKRWARSEADRLFAGGWEGLEQELVRREYKPSTARKYALFAWQFALLHGCRHLERLTGQQVRDFLAGLAAAGHSCGTLRWELCALRAVFDRVLGLGITAGLEHQPRPLPRPAASVAEVEAMLEACETCEEALVVGFLNRDGRLTRDLRLLAFLRPLPAAGEAPAGSRALMVPIDVVPEGAPGTAWVFQSRRGDRPISARTFRRIVARVAARRGLHVTCTALRKAPVVPFRMGA